MAFPSRRSAKSEILLPGEDEAEYTAMEAQFFRDFAPSDALAEALVSDLVALAWKKRRLKHLERRMLADAMAAPLSEEDIPPLRVDWPRETQRLVVQLAFEVPPHRLPALYNTYTFAANMQGKDNVTLQDLNLIEAEHPDLWRRFQELGIQGAYAKVAQIPRPGSDFDTRLALVAITQGVCKAFLRDYFDLPLLISEAEKVYGAVRAVQDKRVMSNAINPEVQRAHAELDRAFSRTLQELRKHQRWRAGAELPEYRQNTRRVQQYKTN